MSTPQTQAQITTPKIQIPDDELVRATKNPRPSILYAESFMIFFGFFAFFAPLYSFTVEDLKLGGMSLSQVDPYFPVVMKLAFIISIFITSGRIFSSFWMLENDIAFKVLVSTESPRKHKIPDLICRALVSLTTVFVILFLWRGWPVEVCFIIASLICLIWDLFMLHIISCRKNDLPYHECENFEDKVKTWKKFDFIFFIIFLLELILLHIVHKKTGWSDISPMTWLVSTLIFLVAIISFEIWEISHLRDDYKVLLISVKSEFKNYE